MARWLLPFLAVFALLGRTVTSYAAAGVIGESECCCPVKAKCQCHDHDGSSDRAPTLKRCGGEAKLVAPAALCAIPVIEPALASEPRVTIASPPAPVPLPDDVARTPEKPPF